MMPNATIKEMNQRQFRAAAARHGFEVRGWTLMDDELGTAYPFIYSTGPKGIRVHYREWLASAIQKRAKERKQREKA
ncbi:MAG TPA: hypothetical protein VKA60_23550 [Blastocatellia bacterium]|nr:hypothetical protein [Blastocatellia bacterium]